MKVTKLPAVEPAVPEPGRRVEKVATTVATAATELRISNLNASYKETPILRDIDLSLLQGEFVCLCGPNGAGKSTLLSVMAGVQDAALKVTGEVRWLSARSLTGEVAERSRSTDGAREPDDALTSVNLQKLPRRDAARIIAYLQQNEYSEWDFTVHDYVLQGRYAHAQSGFFGRFGPANYTAADNAVVDGVLADLSLQQFANRTIHTLSGGEFQKVRLARALAQTPKFLLLDEPAANLDYVFEPHLMQLLSDTAHSKNIGILAAVHDINLAARYADKIILLPPARTSANSEISASTETSASSKKSVLSGTPSDIMNTDNLKYTFGVDFECREIKSFQSLQ